MYNYHYIIVQIFIYYHLYKQKLILEEKNDKPAQLHNLQVIICGSYLISSKVLTLVTL